MLIRKYRAKNLKEALSQVKQELGEGATILSTRTVRSGLLSAQLEVTAALPPLAAPPPPPPPEETPQHYTPAAPALELQHVARFLSPLRQEIKALHSEMRKVAHDQIQADKVEGTLSELCQLLRALQTQQEAHNTQSPSGAVLRTLEEKLLQSGMRPSLVEEIIRAVKPRLPADALEAVACLDALAASLISEDLACLPPLERTLTRRVVAFIGPAGVGKTTTLAKIAARAALLHQQSVAIIGCDTDRIGAVRALEDLSRMIGVPYAVAHDSNELSQAIARFAHCSLVLIDTSGYSAREHEAMHALQQSLARAGAEPILLLNADMRALEIDANLEGFSLVQPRALIFTKLDQAVGLGGLYDMAVSSKLPTMYLTNGRRIPEDIEPASPERLASLIMGFQYN